MSRLISVSVFLFTCILFIGCDKADFTIEGTWWHYESKQIECDNPNLNFGHQEVKFFGPCSRDRVLLCSHHEYTFMPNGDLTYFENGGILNIYHENSFDGSWTLNEGVMTICLNKSEVECTEYQFRETPNGFELTAPRDEGGCIEFLSYHRPG